MMNGCVPPPGVNDTASGRERLYNDIPRQVPIDGRERLHNTTHDIPPPGVKWTCMTHKTCIRHTTTPKGEGGTRQVPTPPRRRGEEGRKDHIGRTRRSVPVEQKGANTRRGGHPHTVVPTPRSCSTLPGGVHGGRGEAHPSGLCARRRYVLNPNPRKGLWAMCEWPRTPLTERH